MASSTQTLAEIKSKEFIDHMKQHFITKSSYKVTNSIQDFVKMYQTLSEP